MKPPGAIPGWFNKLLHRCRKQASTIVRDGATLEYERIYMAMYADAIPRLIRQR